MKNWLRGFTVLTIALMLSGCAKKQEPASQASPGSPTTALKSAFDDGPRAAAAPVDEGVVKQGEKLFKDKGCSACHAFGRKLTCPDLAGVTQRRTAQWMEHQVLHPEIMTKQDPIAHELFAKFALQMPNQGLTEAQAHAVIEYFKHQDHELSTHK